MCRERIVDKFTPIDWIIAGVILIVGLIGSAIKVFWFDDQEIKQTLKDKK